MYKKIKVMKEANARKILGLTAKENPTKRKKEFEDHRERLESFLENSPSKETKNRYQKELDKYEKALEWMRLAYPMQKKESNASLTGVFLFLFVLILGGGSFWIHQEYEKNLAQEHLHQQQIKIQNQKRIAGLQKKGSLAIEKRKWEEAKKLYQSIVRIDPTSQIAQSGFLAIQQGKEDEKNQKIGYLLGNSQAALEAGQWVKATELAQLVLKEYPGNESALEQIKKIKTERKTQELKLKVEQADRFIEEDKLVEAESLLKKLQQSNPTLQVLPELRKKLILAQAQMRLRKMQAQELYQKALALDTGNFSAEALTLLDEAKRLDPQNTVILTLFNKMSQYMRVLQVPAEYKTISLALADARPRDKIQIAKGTYKESLDITKNVRLEGDPNGKTIIEFPAKQGSVIVIRKAAAGTHLSSLTLKHLGFDYSDERLSALIIQGGGAVLLSCQIEKSSGHGIAVIDGAKVNIIGCKINSSGWDGISVYGENSFAEIRNTLSQHNFQQGISFWKGGSGNVFHCKSLANELCGILAMGADSKVSIKTTLVNRNRSAGILISGGVHAELLANRCDNNLLSGIVAQGKGTQVTIQSCETHRNGEVGILVHSDVECKLFKKNNARKNKKRQVWLNAKLKTNL